MRTDRELLELASKAAGMEIQRCRLDDPLNQDFLMNGSGPRNIGQRSFPWNPLTDDGDALRLAADLDLFGDPSYWHWLAIARLSNSTDKHANVRRAIVRAAAEIGSHPKQHNDGGAVYE